MTPDTETKPVESGLEHSKRKAYAMGIIARELHIDFDQQLSADEAQTLSALGEDVLLDEPKSEKGKELKIIVDEEKALADSEYNKAFNFSADLNENKIRPATIFLFQLFAKYAEKIVNDDKGVLQEMMDELVAKLNDLEYPVSYFSSPFSTVQSQIKPLLDLLEGQKTIRDEELLSYAVGVKHPKYHTLTPAIASLRMMDVAIAKMKETTGFTEEDFRGKA